MGIALVIAEPTGLYRRDLRRFTSAEAVRTFTNGSRATGIRRTSRHFAVRAISPRLTGHSVLWLDKTTEKLVNDA